LRLGLRGAAALNCALRYNRAVPALLPLALLGCTGGLAPSGDVWSPDDTASAPVETAEETPWEPEIDARARVVRMSMQLGGHRPRPEWVAGEIDADREAAVLDALLDSPDLGRRVAWQWNELLHVAAYAEEMNRWSVIDTATRRAINWEPLAGIEAIVNEDRSLREIVTATQWPQNDVTAEMLGASYTGVDGSWEWTEYPDDRPMAGLLSSAGLWARHAADATNLNRRRANLVARVLVCADFFDRDVNFELATADVASTAVEEAVRTDATCTTCHASLDPLAAYFSGFGERSEPSALGPWLQYSPRLGEYGAAVFAPAWYGTPAADLSELGPIIADDPRFARCLVRRTYESLTGASFDAEPDRHALVARFVANDLQYDALVRDIVATPAWSADIEHVASADQLATALSDALGLEPGPAGVWTPLEDALFSGELRAMSGDTDDETVLVRNSSVGFGTQLVAEWIARSAASEAIAADELRAPAERLLLPTVDTPGEAEHRSALAGLYLRFLSREVSADSPEIDRLYDLFTAAGADSGAYAEVLLALSRHPSVGVY
jgi:hypothetical protein